MNDPKKPRATHIARKVDDVARASKFWQGGLWFQAYRVLPPARSLVGASYGRPDGDQRKLKSRST